MSSVASITYLGAIDTEKSLYLPGHAIELPEK